MRIFAIGDLHLEGGTGKTMDRFGENWRDHETRIFDGWERVGSPDDLLLLVGDISWAMRLEQAKPGLERIGAMKGTKVMLKGNHDYWWTSKSKMARALDPSIKILQADSIVINRIGIAGTRGWMCPNDQHFQDEDERIYEREVGRLEQAIESLEARRGQYDRSIIALHYPPVNESREPSGFLELIMQFKPDVCVYGHLHGDDIKTGITGIHGKTAYYLVSADSVNFIPARIDQTFSGGTCESD